MTEQSNSLPSPGKWKLSAESEIVRNTGIIFTKVGDETVLMSVQTGKYYGLDDIGTDVWSRLEAPIRIGALCAALAGAYDGAPEDISRDVLALLDKLVDNGLIEVRA